MEHITLHEALRRTKAGRVYMLTDAVRYTKRDPQAERIDAALLVHCRNVLPKVVEALAGLLDAGGFTGASLDELELEPEQRAKIDEARAALTEANSVTLP